MKVKELIVELSKHDPEKNVFTEGCDCWGTAHKVEEVDHSLMGEKEDCILIRRRDDE